MYVQLPDSQSQTLIPLYIRRCCDVESTALTLIQRRNNIVCPVGLSFLLETVFDTQMLALPTGHTTLLRCRPTINGIDVDSTSQ